MLRRQLLSLAFLFFLTGLAAQEYTINGTIIDAQEQFPIVGAIVRVENGEAGTATDLDGKYSLSVPNGDAILIVSYLGYETINIPVDGRTTIDIALGESVSLLEEIVVVGYGTQKRSDISGSVSVIDSDEIAATPALRVEQALQGRAAGVVVTQNSGSPGSSLAVRIRGIGTVSNSDPLYIVDGVPVDGLDFLSPSDIESVNVLKDAASSAIYGSRGANGVVLITTKGGKRGTEGRVSYEAYMGIQEAWKHKHLLNATEYAALDNEARIAAGQIPRPEFAKPEVLGTGTDWQEAIFQTAPITSHQLNFSGGGENSTFAMSGNYFRQEGIVGGEKSDFERYTARMSAERDLKPWLRLGQNLSFTHFTRNALPENNEFTTPLIRALNMDPVTAIKKQDGTYAYSTYAETDIVNPVNQIDQTYDTWNSNRLIGSAYGEVDILEGLSLRSTFSVDVTFANKDLFLPIYNLSNNPLLNDAPAGEIRNVNTVVKENYRWQTWQWENILNYNRTFGESHEFSGLLGTTALQNEYHFLSGANTNLPTNKPEDAFLANTIDVGASNNARDDVSEYGLLSYFGRVNYGYQSKYLASATFRMDGSSRFGANNRYGYFPSFSLAWVPSKENFWGIDAISFFKIRASWGQNGNDRIGDYRYTSRIFSGQNYTFGPDQTITNGNGPIQASNPDLKWETSAQTDIGLDIEFWEGKLNLTVDYFTKKTSDMLYEVPVPTIAGVLPPVQNIGDVLNKGWEFAANYRDQIGKINYTLGGNISFIDNEVTFLGNGGEPTITGYIQSANASVSRTEVGAPIASFYGYQTDGIFQNVEEVEAHAFQSEGTAPGDIRFVDIDGNGVIDSEDQTFIGSPIPDFTYALTGSLELHGFDLGIFIQGSHGNDIYNGTVRYDLTSVNLPVTALDRWTGPGTSDSEPRLTNSDPNQNVRVSDRFVEDGSYLRIKNVQLGYLLPNNLVNRLRMDKVRFYVSGQNLYTFTKYSGLDPEIGITGDLFSADGKGRLEIGIDRGFYPVARTFIAGLQITF